MSLNQLSDDARKLNVLVATFTSKVPRVASTLLLSADGLPLVLSDDLDRDTADQLSAIASGLSSLTDGAARCLSAGAVKQTVVEMESGFLFVQTIAEGSILSVLTTTDPDLGLIGYEMALLVARLGDVLSPALRGELKTAPPT